MYISSLKCSWFSGTLCVPPVVWARNLHMWSSADNDTTEARMVSCFRRLMVARMSPGSQVDRLPKITKISLLPHLGM